MNSWMNDNEIYSKLIHVNEDEDFRKHRESKFYKYKSIIVRKLAVIITIMLLIELFLMIHIAINAIDDKPKNNVSYHKEKINSSTVIP